MESKAAGQERTPRDIYAQLSPRCGGARVDVKDESKNKFRKTECFVDGRSDRNVRTIKDRRNHDLIREDLKYLPENEPLAYVSITCGNSGYSLGRFAQEIGEEAKRDIFVVNIVPLGLSQEIIKMLKECSIVVEMDLTEKVTFNEMREIAIRGIKEKHGISIGYDNVKTVERVGLENGYRDIVKELKAQGPQPTHILCPAGAGELLVAIAKAAKEIYPENPPQVIGVTGHDNILAHFEILGEDGFIAVENSRDNPDDKLASGYSALLGEIRSLQAEGIVEILAVDLAQIAKAWNDILELGIDSEPSAAVAFAGAFAYAAELKPSDNLVIINSGKGIFDEKNAERFLEKNYKKDQIDWEGKNGLMRAIDRDDIEMARLLLEEIYEDLAKEEAYARDYKKGEAEWEAERKSWMQSHPGEEDPWEGLFLYDGDENEVRIRAEPLKHQDKRGETPIMQALRMGRGEIADAFLDILVRSSRMASFPGYSKDLLRESLEIRDEKGKTILARAIESRNYRFALGIMEHADEKDVNAEDGEKVSILQGACLWRDGEGERIIRKLVEKGARIGDWMAFDFYPPALAAEWASIETVRLLVNKAEEEYREKIANAERLRGAIRSGDFGEVADLTGKGITLNEPFCCLNDRYLRIAIGRWDRGDAYRLERLVEAGMRVDRPNSDGETPVEYAIFCGNADAVRFLFRHGAKHPELNEGEAIKRAEEIRREYSLKMQGMMEESKQADAECEEIINRAIDDFIKEQDTEEEKKP